MIPEWSSRSFRNAHHHAPESTTKADVAAIRHLYLDPDKDGERSLAAIQASKEISQPDYVLSTSPGKYQVIWKVEGMSQSQAELQKRMVEAFGGDPAATDSTRVLRLPGFDNKKYQEDYRVEARELSTAAYRLSDFKLGEHRAQTPEHAAVPPYSHLPRVTAKRTPSDHDWRWAQDRLRSGESISLLIQRLESAFRIFDEKCRVYQYIFTANGEQILYQTYGSPVIDAAIESRIAFLSGKAESLYSLRIYFVILFEGFRYKQALISTVAKVGSEPREAWSELKGYLSRRNQVVVIDS